MLLFLYQPSLFFNNDFHNYRKTGTGLPIFDLYHPELRIR